MPSFEALCQVRAAPKPQQSVQDFIHELLLTFCMRELAKVCELDIAIFEMTLA